MMKNNIKEKVCKKNYGIIEKNFNPAIIIKSYPNKEKNKKLLEKY